MIPFPALGHSSRPDTPLQNQRSIRTRTRTGPPTTGPVQTETTAATRTATPIPSDEPPLSRHVRDHDRDSKGKGGHARRPETPLDFFHTMHRRVRSSMDSERLERAADVQLVDHPRGVPYAFPDDLTTGPSDFGPTLSLGTKSMTASTAAGGTPARRLGTLRENTRSKLASLSGFGKEHGHGHGQSGTSGAMSALTPTSASVSPVKAPRLGLSGRSASFATGQTLTTRPAAMGPRHPSMYTLTTPGLTEDLSATTFDSTSMAEEHSQAEDVVLPSSPMTYPASLTSTQSSSSNAHRRERVMGLRVDDRDASVAKEKAFVPQKVSDVVPFAEGHPFAAWDAGDVGADKTKRRPSMTVRRMVQVDEVDEMSIRAEGVAVTGVWRTNVRGKKHWSGDVGAYRIGWERAVLDMEARIHEALWEVNESHTFAEFPEGQEPKTVLDIGTGTGMWPISQALVWPKTTFIGLDIVPCQTDLSPLVECEKRARSTSEGMAHGEGMWEGLARRISWDRADFLDRLPYDDAVFDMVHIRFCGLSILESKWCELLEECARVLRKGGTLEIVEMAYAPPENAPPSVRNAFASLLLADMVQANPLLPLQFNLPACQGLKATVRPTWEKTFRGGPGMGHGTMGEAVMVWVRSALGYKGTGLKKGCEGKAVLAELSAVDPVWSGAGIDGDEGDEEDAEGTARGTAPGTSVWAWVVTRR